VAEINLLKQKSSTNSFAAVFPSVLAKILIVVALGVIGYYGWLFVEEKKITSNTVQLQNDIANAKKDALGRTDRYELLTRQGQLIELGKLAGDYGYFTKLFKPLADNTLKFARYTGIKATSDGDITLSVVVPNLESLDKYFQFFNTSYFAENFSDVKIGGYYKVKEKNSEYYTFDIKMKYNTGLIKQKP